MKTDLPDLGNDSKAILVMKRPIPVKVEFAESSGICQTLEGDVRFNSGDAIITGPNGEQWPIDRKKFERTYRPITNNVSPDKGKTYVKRPIKVLAKQLEKSTTVPVGDKGEVLNGKAGDWLIEYAPGEFGIVAKDVFEKTYSILNQIVTPN